jgi:hypothetical protein
MNAASTRPAASPSIPSRTDEASCRRDDAAHVRQADVFERLLRSKSALQDRKDDADGGEEPPALDAGAAGLAAPPASLPRTAGAGIAPLQWAPAQAGAGAAGEGAERVAKALHGSATQGAPLPNPLAAGTLDAGATWNVSLHQPLGPALELRATRSVGSPESQSTWMLTIGSSVRDAAMLAQHAPRLNERLRSRALDHSHVRIEGRDEETP